MLFLKKTGTTNKTLQVRDLGLTAYKEVLELQHQLREKRYHGRIPETVLILEHKPVITLGARQSANKLVTEPQSISQRNVDIFETRRGGGVTAHNPGQLVFYPILNLRNQRLTIRAYITKLEVIGQELLGRFGLETERRKDFPGLWIEDRKIASIGVRISKFITYHGMAINFQNDLSIFDLFVPCGIDGVKITSVYKETGRKHSFSKIKKILTQLVIKHFSR